MELLRGILVALLMAGAIGLMAACSSEPQPEMAQPDVDSSRSREGSPAAQSGTSNQPASSSEDVPAARRGAPARVREIAFDDGSGPKSLRIITQPSPNLPDRPAEVSGVFVERQDNSILVGTGGMTLDVDLRLAPGGAIEPQVSLGHDGPIVEVVVTRDTVIYRDETETPNPRSADIESGEHTVQQVVEPVDSLDELGSNTELQVWGERRGDRVVAAVLAYRIVQVII